jgi:predicted phosphodiesterase
MSKTIVLQKRAQILVLSDIHANLEALKAVLDHAHNTHGRPDQIWFLGDLVGYGPNPKECIDELRGKHPLTKDITFIGVKGNHEEGVLLARDGKVENPPSEDVGKSWEWTASRLSTDQFNFLENLHPSIILDSSPSLLLVHASPKDDHMGKQWSYLQIPTEIRAVVSAFDQKICFFGHTHLACYFLWEKQRYTIRPRLFPREMSEPVEISLNENQKMMINPGAVGQPRWGRVDPEGAYVGEKRASYLWLTLDPSHGRGSMICHFVPYDFHPTVDKMKNLPMEEGKWFVPTRWLDRLEKGMR